MTAPFRPESDDRPANPAPPEAAAPDSPPRPSSHHLAQLNVARLRAPLDSPQLADFVAQLDPVNAHADAAPGFVWRLRDDAGRDASGIRPYQDDTVMVNMSVWTSLASLWEYVYRSPHLEVMRRRREWFHRMAESHQVLWWVPIGHIPDVAEGMARLERLRALGPSPQAFTFREAYPPPEVPDPAVPDPDGRAAARR